MFILRIVFVFWISHLCSSLKVGDACMKGDVPGLCNYEENCTVSLAKIRSHADRYEFTETNCGFEGIKQIVCCPTQVNEKRPSELACERFPSRPTKQPKLDIHIFGGTEAKEEEFPQFAALAMKAGKKTKFNCGGLLISSKFVLTAAHCLKKESFVMFVRLGTTNLTAGFGMRDVNATVINPH